MESLCRTFRIPMACAAALSILTWAQAAPAQDETEATVGSRVQEKMDVDWESMRREEAQRGRMDPETGALLEAPSVVATVPREELNKANLPVLLPDDGRLIERMRLIAKPNFYVASLRDDNHSFQITGTRIAQGELLVENAPERMIESSDEEGYIYQQTEYGCELSFTRYNVSYNISVECREPDTDPRCTGKEYIMQLAKSLVYVGGVPQGNDNR